jgi:UDP-N-acetylmuramoyl-L-alanyl-D-glutamate--2,6-diaminopimelate ligase
MTYFDQLDSLIDYLKTHIKSNLSTDSRQINSGDVFIAWPGAAVDGRQFIDQALAKGASLCIVESQDIEKFNQTLWFNNKKVITIQNLKACTGAIAAAYYGHPTQKIKMLAVTGTNGKTSSAWWIASTLQQLQLPTQQKVRCAIAGTLGIGEPHNIVANGLTTPDPVLLQKSLSSLYQDGVTHCAIEASSIGLAEKRLAGCEIELAVFTNLTQDHLDYHGNMQNYWQAKQELFDWPGLKSAVINIDDAHGHQLAAQLQTRQSLDVWTISCQQKARIQARDIVFHADSVSFEVLEHSTDSKQEVLAQYSLKCNIIGSYNVSNLLGVMAALRSLGFDLAAIIKACENLSPVPGRMEVISHNNCPTIAIDYAHTPDALEKALLALSPSTQNNGGQLWCVFGCGGNRDTSKRPLMAKIAELYSDHIILTSDNPRFEDPLKIIADAQAGFTGLAAKPIQILVNRADAIDWAITHAQANDVILIAGKGHEPYQEIEGVQHDFSDMNIARLALNKRSTKC